MMEEFCCSRRGWRNERLVRAILVGVFFVSGFTALLYQVVWQRMLALFSGTDVYSITIIVSAFMGGLGCGSLVGGHVADGVSRRARILLFAAAELLVSGFALGSKWLYYDLLYGRFGNWPVSSGILAVVLFASLLWPTFLMGTSLPLLARTLVDRIESASDRVGTLYGVNTLGAAAGAFVTTWGLQRVLGFERSLQFGAALNLACALGALAAWRWTADRGEERAIAPSGPGIGRSLGPGPSVGVWISVYALSGFVALGLEILWFRMLGVVLKGMAFTFGHLLGIYLTGLAAGTLLGRRWARLAKEPGLAFLALQGVIPLYAALSVILLVSGLEQGGSGFGSLNEYLARYEPLGVGAALKAVGAYASDPVFVEAGTRRLAGWFVMLYVALPAVIVLPPTLMMGLSFPLLQRIVQNDPGRLGRRVGWLQTSNIAGSMLGAVLVGWGTLGTLGTSRTLALLIAAGVVLVAAGGHAFWPMRRRLEGLAVAAIATVFAFTAWCVPASTRLWARFHGVPPEDAIVVEDATGLTVITTTPGTRAVVFTGGVGQSWLPYGGVHSWLGLLPALLHPRPERIAIIGLGSGDTLFSVGGRGETREILCVEIVSGQWPALGALCRRGEFPVLGQLFADGRLRLQFADGRTFLRRSAGGFDVIESDALRPHSAFAGNLYSFEYFSLLRDRLGPGGLAVTWAPTGRAIRTFVKVFPYVLVADIENLAVAIGSTAPVAWDTSAMVDRLGSPQLKRYYGAAGFDFDHLMKELLAIPPPRVYEPDYDRESIIDCNTDLYPRDEFLAPAVQAGLGPRTSLE